LTYNYYILNAVYTTNKQALKTGVRIQKIPTTLKIKFKVSEGEGPFLDLPSLKRKSTIYRNIVLRNQKRAQQICEEKHIDIFKDYIWTDESVSVPLDFIALIEHCLRGRVQNGNVTGIHFYDAEFVRVVRVLKEDNFQGTWEADIEFYNEQTNKWIKKKSSSTFFPKTWTLSQLFHECLFAVKNKHQKLNHKNIFLSTTESGINVEIIEKNGKLTSIYPTLKSHK
tara:strand:+ start:2703 stop:3377 length:675 start_codon:yes stop_codon:yes gene_type:complete